MSVNSTLSFEDPFSDRHVVEEIEIDDYSTPATEVQEQSIAQKTTYTVPILDSLPHHEAWSPSSTFTTPSTSPSPTRDCFATPIRWTDADLSIYPYPLKFSSTDTDSVLPNLPLPHSPPIQPAPLLPTPLLPPFHFLIPHPPPPPPTHPSLPGPSLRLLKTPPHRHRPSHNPYYPPRILIVIKLHRPWRAPHTRLCPPSQRRVRDVHV